MSEGQRARTEGSGGTRIYLEIGLMRCMGMTGRSGRELGRGPRVLQSSVLLQDIHPSTRVGPGWRLGLLRQLRLALSLPEPTVSW